MKNGNKLNKATDAIKATSQGPAQVNSSWLRNAWDRIFGKKPANTKLGVTELVENSSKPLAASVFEDGATGAASSIASRRRIVPGLRFHNPNPRGRDVVRFDGIDGTTKPKLLTSALGLLDREIPNEDSFSTN